MQPELIVIDSVSAIKELGGYLADKTIVAYDSETTGLTKRDRVVGFSICAEESKAFYVILESWNSETNQLDPKPYLLEARELLESLISKQLIMHNSVFDCMMAESYFKVRLIDSLHTDTMILAHLLNENRRVGLKELAKEYFGEDSTKEQQEMKESVKANGGVLTKACYEMFKADSHLLGKYGAKDALLTYKLFLELVPELYTQCLHKFFYEEESMPLLKTVTYELNTTGLQVDTTRMAALKKQLEAECLEAKAFIYQEIHAHIKDKYPGTTKKNVFNIGSSSQLSWLLFGELGLEFNTLTDAGKAICKALGLKTPYTFKAKRDFIELCKQAKDRVHQPSATVNGKAVKAKTIADPWKYIAVDKAALKRLAPKHLWVEKLLEYQRKQKLLNTYIKGIETRIQYGVIQPSYLQHGTTSGRFASRNPNLMNLPRDDQRIKECFVARQGKVFVSADYSQLEPRVFSYYSQDKRLMDVFNGDDDFYSFVGMETFDLYDCTPRKDGSTEAFGVKYKKRRDDAKTIALATAYGATAYQLMKTTGKSEQETQEDIDTYFEKFPGVKKMMDDAHTIAKKNGYVTSLFGRPRRMPEAKKIDKIYGSGNLPYEARNLLNLAVNHRIQSTGASIVNRASVAFYINCKKAGIDCKVVNQIHDELVVECNQENAENVALLLQEAMENTTILEGVALEAVPRITRTLAK